MADIDRGNRPLSPHLQVYKWPLNMAMSILHRITGVAIGAMVALLALWFLALASGPEAYSWANALAMSWLGILILLGGLVSIWFHFANGLRHLVWDTGSGLGQKRVRRSAIAGIVTVLVLTALTLWVAVSV
ncbi:MAG: succinate dehydrogenase, cytochrome b556 subunit [Alphaproteobacteria bacterium]|nr:MAG: succinate dehydrogenase, cytochrome b556 subunit [Alphaproteobacteria bacterium]